MKQCRNTWGQFQAHEFYCEDADAYGTVTYRCCECDQEYHDEVSVVDDGGGSTLSFKGSLWDAREHIEPPYDGMLMFADSCPETNVPHLIECGVPLDEITIYRIGWYESVWADDKHFKKGGICGGYA